ncbi:type VI secretion system tip protein VgrG [Portibacter lacus]|uniref:Gp5/Type VI secretion system Vgr protein OB-fold domain-containing protein n=1 Tax=Portibacter lacus TaxID=1099794 RepID=A0AA37WF75_9BACT|nr:type VI secretion system tip protein VgrG [Portibacter lacus]GLR16710.1 hypothetical protein GCM10007940_13250 [Portibacter lacus]
MAKHSLYDQKTDLVALDVKIDGQSVSDKVQIDAISVYKSLYKISTAKIEINDGNISDAKFETIENESYEHGKEVEIKMGYHNDKETVFKGIIVKHSIKISSSKSSKIILECADKAIKMTGQRNFEYHKSMKDSDIISKLISDYGISKEVDSTNKQHEMVVQHNTSNWDFVIARAQANKMVVATDDGKIKVKKPSTGGAVVDLIFGENIIDMDLSIDGRTQVQDLETMSWDPKKQETVTSTGADADDVDKLGNLKGKSIAGDLGYGKTELHSTGNMDTEELKQWADGSVLLSRLSRVRGIIKTQGIKVNPIDTVELKSLGKYYDGEAFVSGVFHEQKDGNWITEIELGISPDLFVKQKNDINLPVADGLFPGVHGLFIGKVKKIDGDPEGEFRVQVTLPMVDGANGEGVWARMSNLMASDKFGSWFCPEVDDEVVCGALGGDLRFPVILGHLYSSKRPYAESEFAHNSQNNEKGWYTREELLFHFNDKDKIIRIETPGGQKFKLDDKDKSITLEDQHSNKMVMDSSGFKFSGNKDFIVDVQGKMDLKAGRNILVKSTMGGNFDAEGMMVKVKGTGSATVEGSGSVTVTSTGMAALKGSIVMIN